MIRIYFFKRLTIIACFFNLALHGVPVVPITFRPSMHHKHFEKEIFGIKVKDFLHHTFTKMQLLTDKCGSTHSSEHLHTIGEILAYFSMQRVDTLLEHTAFIEKTLTPINPEAYEECQRLCMAINIKAMEQVLMRAHAESMCVLTALEQHSNYWDQQYASRNYSFVYRSPFKWLHPLSRKAEIIHNKTSIDDIRAAHQKMIGYIAALIAEFDPQASLEAHYHWISRCCIQLSCVSLSQPLTQESIPYDNCTLVIKELNRSFHRYSQRVLKKAHNALMPSHIERYWAVYTALASAMAISYAYMKKNPKALSSLYRNIKNVCVQNYSTHIQKPLFDIKKALFMSKDEGDSATEKIQKLIKEMKPSQEAPEKVKEDYYRICTDISKSLKLDINEQKIRNKAETLDGMYLLEILQAMFDIFKDNGWVYLVKQSPKYLVIDHLPSMISLIGRAGLVTGQDFSIKAADIIVARFDELDKKLNLTIAGIALLPVLGLTWGIYKVVRSFGGYVLPKGYNDAPVRDYITKMHDLLDDAWYIHPQEPQQDLTMQLLGSLFFYSAQLKDEIENLSQKKRADLHNLLEKFYLSTSVDGKKLYLEKMLHEYYSWPRFIQH